MSIRTTATLTLGLVAIALSIATRSGDAADEPARDGAAFNERTDELRRTLPAGFTVAIARPFVVAGDEPSEMVRRHAECSVAWAVDTLRRQYFAQDPDRAIADYQTLIEILNIDGTTAFQKQWAQWVLKLTFR